MTQSYDLSRNLVPTIYLNSIAGFQHLKLRPLKRINPWIYKLIKLQVYKSMSLKIYARSRPYGWALLSLLFFIAWEGRQVRSSLDMLLLRLLCSDWAASRDCDGKSQYWANYSLLCSGFTGLLKVKNSLWKKKSIERYVQLNITKKLGLLGLFQSLFL